MSYYDTAKGVLLVNPTTKDLMIGDPSGAFVVIHFSHSNIHKGISYSASYVTPNGSQLADDANLDLLLITGTKISHMIYGAACGGDAEVRVYENVGVSDNGTSIPIINLNRTSGNQSTNNVYQGPTVTSLGSVLEETLMPGGDGGNSTGGQELLEREFILKSNTNYLVRLTNRAGGQKLAAILLRWYEVP